MNYLLDDCESERLLYRRIKQSDYEDWLPFFQSPLASQHWISDSETPEVTCKKWYEKQYWRYEHNQGGINAIIEKKSGQLVGHCGLLLQTVDETEELEIAYSLLPQFWDKGYATEAARLCKTFAFDNQLAESLISIISLGNEPSQKVARKNGMQIEKTTVYKSNKVYIFRISRARYLFA